MAQPSSVGKTNNRTDQMSLAQLNVDGTPNLQDTTTVWDLRVKKSRKKRCYLFKTVQPLHNGTTFSIKQ
jgi:hypothetical protein